MNEQLERAQDAQMDWALGEAVGESTPPDLLATVRRQLESPAPQPKVRGSARAWLTAACVLLGLGAVIAAWQERPEAQPAVPLQQPAPPPPQEPEPVWLRAGSTEELAQVPEQCTALRLFPTDVKMVEAVARLQRLTHLDLGLGASLAEQAPLDQAMLHAVGKLSKLRLLRLDFRAEIETAWLQELAGLPLLETLGLKFVDMDDATAVRLSTLPSLRKLDLSFSKLSDDALAALVTMPGLRELSLRGCGKLTAAGLTVLGKATRLEVLDLTGVIGSSSGVPPPRGRTLSMKLVQQIEGMMLTELTVAGARTGKGVNDEVLQALKPLQKLRELRLRGCVVTAAGLAAVPAERLRTLDLTVRTGDGAALVAVLPPALETLGLASSVLLKDAELEAIAKRVPNLRRVDLKGCTGIGDTGLEKLLQCPITELSLESCTGLTSASLPVLLASPTLRKLDVTGLMWIDEAAQMKLKAMPGLELEFRGLHQLLRR